MKVEGKVSYEIESNNMKDFKPSRPVINRWVLLILSTAVFYKSLILRIKDTMKM